MEYSFVKQSLISTLIFHSIVSFVQIFDLLLTFNGQLMIKYGPYFFMSLLVISLICCFMVMKTCFKGLAAIAVALLTAEKLKVISQKNFQQLQFSKSPTVEKKILYESKKLTYFAIVNLILFSTTLIFYFPSPLVDLEEDFYYSVVLFRKKFSSTLSRLLTSIYYVTFPNLFFITTGNCFCVCYMIMYERFQVYIINDLLKNISSDYAEDTSDESYQNKIRQNLTVCIKRHQLLTNIMYNNLIAQVGQNNEFLRSSLTSLTAIINTSLFVYNGQSLIDETMEMMENISKCPWTTWDVKNQKTLLYFMTNAQKPLTLGATGVFICEYPFAV
ncbi:7tm 6 domain containing protein, partial [Asbolus verrucosus]